MLQEDRLRGGLLVCGVSRRAVPAAGARSGSVAGEADRKLSTGAPRAIARPRSEGPTYSGFTPSPVHAIVGAWLCLLTRRRDPDALQETWLVYYGDVRVGAIAKRSGNPADIDLWG